MKTSYRPFHLLLQLIHITLFPVFLAQKTKVSPNVTGYLGKDVTLSCQLIQGPTHTNITQVQWALEEGEGTQTKKVTLIVFNTVFGMNVSDTPLKERVKFDKHSLIIKDVEMRDAGSYTCSISTFPSGTFEGTTKLVIQEKMPLSAEMALAIVIAAVLLLVIMVAVAYLVCLRRHQSSDRHHVVIDMTGPERDEATSSVIVRDEDVVYSDVKVKPSRDTSPLFTDMYRDSVYVDDTTYSEIVLSCPQLRSDMESVYV